MFVWPWCWSICICVFTHFFLYWPFLVTKDALCWAQLMILVVLWQILLIRYWFTLFFLVKPFQIYLQAPSYLMRHWTTSYHRADLEKFFFSILQFSFIVSCLYFFLRNFMFFFWDNTFILILFFGLLLLLMNFVLHSLLVCSQVSVEYLTHLVIVMFGFIYLYRL